MSGFEWFAEGPPPRLADKKGKYAAILEEVAKKPGEWARIPMTSSGGAGTLAREIKRGKKAPGKWEAVSRTQDGTIYTFVKYIGPE